MYVISNNYFISVIATIGVCVCESVHQSRSAFLYKSEVLLLGHLEFLPRVVSSPYPETRKELSEVVEFLYHSPSKAIFQSHLSVSSE